MALKIYVNVDSQDEPYGTSGVDWVEIDLTNDKIICTNGSDIVADGESLPSESALNRAATLLETTIKNVAKYFLYDYSAGQLKEISLMGNVDGRYVFAFEFDAATNSEPVAEAWDTSGLNSTDDEMLGAGTPANSWLKGVCTTSGTPGDDWVGIPMAGSGAGYFLELNDGSGALDVADVLYANFKVVIPATAVTAFAVLPVLNVKYT